MTRKTIAAVASGLVAVSAVVWLVLSSAGDSMVYYKTVEELLAQRARWEGRPIRVNGLLVEGSVRQRPGTDEYLFRLTKQGREIEVSYRGVLPDAMGEGRELVVQGSLQPGSDRFVATEILTKCPSKYENAARALGP